MTREIFTNWLKSWDRKLIKDKRKICLIIDNCSAHIVSHELVAIKIVFLPANTTAVLQSLDQGIIQAFKTLFRKQLLRKIIAYIDEKKSSANEILDKITLIDTLFMVKSTWDSLPPNSINKIFQS